MKEYNVCGVLVMVRPENSSNISQAMNALDGVEVHAQNPDGRLVVTVEGALGRECADTLSHLAGMDGVISTSLIYHEIDTEQPLEELTE